MSWGLTPYDLVQQVFYAQEKVLLDFRPDDDKYKEVLVEANLVLQELQKEEDWTWLRHRLVLGSVDDADCPGRIPEFQLPEWVYKVSTLHDDCVRLYLPRHDMCCSPRGHVHTGCHCCDDPSCLDEWNFIEVPYVSVGRLNGRTMRQNRGPSVNVSDRSLGAVTVGDNVLTFTRPLLWGERSGRIAVCDVQRRIPLLHVCSDSCPRDEDGRCTLIEDRVLTEVPDPNYVIMRTAALHAEGSPPAQGRVQSLQDNAQKLLSAMRQNDASATDADYIDWDPVWHVDVI